MTGSRRDEILAIAALQFAERGVASTTVRDIGAAAGILSGSLYHHFESKEQILGEVQEGRTAVGQGVQTEAQDGVSQNLGGDECIRAKARLKLAASR